MQLSRRQFLQFSGIALLASRLDGFGAFFTPSTTTAYQGRALAAVAVYRSPSTQAEIVRTLWPDSLTPLTDVQAGWYRVPEGWVQREQLQPVTPFTPPAAIPMPEAAFWAEVAAPVAPVRAWCAADAPLVGRIGHGGVAQVIDALPADQPGQVWYGIAGENGALLGWTPGVRWRGVTNFDVEAGVGAHGGAPYLTSSEPAVLPPLSVDGEGKTSAASRGEVCLDHFLEITRSTHTLTAWEHDTAVLTAPVATHTTHPGRYTVTGHYPGVTVEAVHTTFLGIPWALDMGAGGLLAGAYWHNRFGADVPGPALQVTPALARWLYGWLKDGDAVIINA